MTDLLKNAIVSIQLGIEDFQSNDDRRPISAVRNFYAGVLLLGKHCLLNEAPKASPMDVLASRYIPVPDGDGDVQHEPKGYQTIDLQDLRQRFKAFDLDWPDGGIKALQTIRNDFEHFHSPAPTAAIREAIAGCFPLVVGFFNILEVDPSQALGETWETMLAEEAFFQKQKTECDASFTRIPWFSEFQHTDEFSCPHCSSALLFQLDADNDDPASIEGRCKSCGGIIEAEKLVSIIVEAEFGGDDYISVKDGDVGVIHDCNECWNPTYITNGEVSSCFLCGHEIRGECGMCMVGLSIENISADSSSLCSYCDHLANKDD